MQVPAHINVDAARLPQTYEAARNALANCAQVDECRDWANKAEALASYAKQSNDDTLHKMAERIRGRAVRRCGELLKQFNTGPDGGRPKNSDGGVTVSQKRAASDAGMSERQRVTAVRVANVPEKTFNDAIEAANPPTVTQLADMGRKPRARPEIEIPASLAEPVPEGFQEATHWLGALRRYADECGNAERIANGLMSVELAEARSLIARIDGFHDRIVVNLKG